MDDKKKFKLYMVTMSHWDREWYLNFQGFRIRLVHLMDSLLDILDNDPNFVSYMLDGQTIALEDYLEIKPYNEERIRKYVDEGRIVIGPWYILPDEILVSGESHIRNWLMGDRVSRRFGKKMNIGYLPDSFGHPSQMPQILTKLGMEATMFWRGAGPEADKTELNWRAPDGSTLLTVLLPSGYSTGAEFPDDPETVAKRLDKYIEVFEPYSTTDMIYLSNGGDHLEPVPYLSSLVSEVNRRMKRGEVIHTTLPAFIKDLKAKVRNLKTIDGEMCGVNTSILLASTLSTRIHLKQLNHKAYTLLENELEPISSIAGLLGHPYPRDILLHAWRYFLKNMPHDSICGCSVDDVHRDMLYRYDQVFEIGDYLRSDLKEFFGGIDSKPMAGKPCVAVFNTTSNDRTDLVEAVVDLDDSVMAELDFNDVERGLSSKHHADTDGAGQSFPTSIRVFDGTREIPCVLDSAELANKLELHWQTYPRQSKVNRCRISFIAPDVPAMGYKSFSILPVYTEKKPLMERMHLLELENDFFVVTPNLDDGTVAITDKRTGAVYAGCNALADSGDCGDEYSYCPPEEDRVVRADKTSLAFRMVERSSVRQALEIRGAMLIPETVLEENRRRSDVLERCEFATTVTLYPEVERIDVKTDFDNRARFHRVRVLFPTGLEAAVSHSAGIFSVDSRPIEPVEDPNWQEKFFTHPQKDFVDVNDGKLGLTVANRGLPEFEVYNVDNRAVIAVTLLRCVGQISKQMIKTRKAMGGWTVDAPEGQCLGAHRFEYSILPHRGSWEDARVYIGARDFNQPMPAMHVGGGKGSLPSTKAFITLEPGELVVSAFKKCEFGEGSILRFYNTTGKAVKGGIRFGFPVKGVELAGLDEKGLRKLDVVDGGISIEAGAWSIVTLKIET
jgi:mannosylglycerate hydrolase